MDYFCKKAPSWIIDKVLNTPLDPSIISGDKVDQRISLDEKNKNSKKVFTAFLTC